MEKYRFAPPTTDRQSLRPVMVLVQQSISAPPGSPSLSRLLPLLLHGQGKKQEVSISLGFTSHIAPMYLHHIPDKVQTVACALFPGRFRTSETFFKQPRRFLFRQRLPCGEEVESYTVNSLPEKILQDLAVVGNQLDLVAELIFNFLSVLDRIREEIIKNL